MKNQKGFTPIIILVILALVVGGYFAYQNVQLKKSATQNQPTPAPLVSPSSTPDATANWKIFSDEQNGIEFKYPQTWDAEKMLGWTFNVFLDDRSFEIPTQPTEFMTLIGVAFNEFMNTETNIKSYAEKTVEEAATRLKTYFFGQDVTEKDGLTVDGHKAIQLDGILGPGMLEGQYFKYTLIQMDDKVLMVSLNINRDFERIYDQILTTFKFLEPVDPRGEGLQKLDRCVPTTESGATKCYGQTTKEDCLKFTSECRWKIAVP